MERSADLPSEPRDERWFLPERTDSTAGPGAVIARSGNRLQRAESPPPLILLERCEQTFSSGIWVRS